MNKMGLVLFVLVLFQACSVGSDSTDTDGSTNQGSTACTAMEGNSPAPIASNVMAIHVGCGYVNEPCVSVSVCSPGTNNCQTIPNILLDTGSYGLRVFSCAASGVALTQQNDSSGKPLAECVSYADGSSEWGPVKVADVILAGEKASNVPIQIIDANYNTPPTDCTQLDTSPVRSGFNGILGVGLLTYDCGSACATTANNRMYFSCSESGCSSIAVPVTKQVANPVSFLPVDNNGVIVTLPNIPASGATSLNGSLTLGIGTKTNNAVGSSVVSYPASSRANFKTQFNSSTYNAFLDTGSNGLFFPGSTLLTSCSSIGGAYGFFCPANPTSLTATISGTSGTPTSSTIGFQIINAESALRQSNPNIVFSTLGGQMNGNFDWGLPFFIGRTVYVGISGTTSSLGTGPYWGF